jgi:pyridoxine kinase
MRLLSFSSQVVLGHVGNAALALPLARLGVELLAVPTVLFSNHPGYGGFGGGPLESALLRGVLDGLEARGLPQGLDAVLSGYLGLADNAMLLADRLEHWRRERPDLPYLLDPVMGDAAPGSPGRLYVVPELPALLRHRLLPLADWITPNPFELALLTEGEIAADAGTLVQQARGLLGRRCRGVLVTSYLEGESLGLLLVTPAGAWALLTPRLAFAVPPNGAGDLLAGLFLAELLPQTEPLAAARRALARLQAVLAETLRQGGRELALLAAQDRLAIGEEKGVAVRSLG